MGSAPTQTELEAWISRERYQLFRVAANHDHDVTRRLYEWNATASGAFLELLSYLEVILRNAVDSELATLEVPPTARVQSDRGWWFSSPTFLAEPELKKFETARSHIRDPEKFNRDKVLSSLTFSFWQSIFGGAYEELFRHHSRKAFSAAPNGFQRKDVSRRLDALRLLRNKVAHHQPIHDYPLEEQFEQALELREWTDPRACEWVRDLSTIPAILAERPIAIDSLVMVVPAKLAWELYGEVNAYVCQPGRYFRQVSHVGFYLEGAIQPEVAKVLDRQDDVPWTSSEVGRLMGTRDPRDRRLADIIKQSRARGWVEDRYQVFFLTAPDASGRADGHVTLERAISNTRTGRGSAWVQRQRYVTVAALLAARNTSDLESPASAVKHDG
jgi:hypothetical protein